ncbi:hypothetical protein M4D70_15720 [Brevibacillus borstelensis]|uniref:hypothetical protein n=1 Tax=Brevibacillus borstelensis TaxID=45462 RepID=UPI0020413D43|nr:hypothetical protein [Brevibacillus borstelensis]MCM3623682.1 hypothetical protein [Brevibacillus borstelensis]
MSKHMANIEIYGNCVDDLDVSPFESVDMLHRRSKIDLVAHELTYEERMKLLSYDMQLIKNAKLMYNHITEIYDFTLSDEPLRQWWWHMDKIVNGEIAFNLCPVVVSHRNVDE